MKDELFEASLIEQSPDCISGYDAALTITLWNSACDKKFGLSKNQALEKPLLTLFPKIEKITGYSVYKRQLKRVQAFSFLTFLTYLRMDFIHRRSFLFVIKAGKLKRH